MNVPEFQARWGSSTLTTRDLARSYFLDLSELGGHQKPAELDPAESFFAFEKSTGKTGGIAGFANVWCPGHFHKKSAAFMGCRHLADDLPPTWSDSTQAQHRRRTG